MFVPYDKPLDTLPSSLLSSVEGLLIYFDADKVSIYVPGILFAYIDHMMICVYKRDSLAVIKDHLEYLESNQIGLVLLLCDQLFDDDRQGITYTEVKQSTRLMDVIELGRQKEEHDDDECEDHYDPLGYDEVLQVLQNFIWSHVDVLQVTDGNAVGGLAGVLAADLFGEENDEQPGADLSTPAAATSKTTVEAEHFGDEENEGTQKK